uniref:Uncharacterized protein n=1 Tax=Ditylenchus dipsaci TaxID=166011 RepID=A0A915EGG8_9BILA
MGQILQAQSPCADQVQRCGILVEEFERQIQDVKTVAFRNCFTKTPCVQERIAFEDCFGQSLRAVRKPTTETNQSVSSPTVRNYQSQLEQCLSSGNNDKPASSTSVPPGQNKASVDEDAIYARAIYSTEFADRLWGLPETVSVKASLNPQEACLVKDLVTRVFGGGISRIVDSSNPRVNNLNTSCMLSTEDLTCYRRSLDEDNEFQQMVQNRDRALRSCIQSVRVQTDCHKGDNSRIRSCVCNAREEFDTRMQSEVIFSVSQSTAPCRGSHRGLPEDHAKPMGLAS